MLLTKAALSFLDRVLEVPNPFAACLAPKLRADAVEIQHLQAGALLKVLLELRRKRTNYFDHLVSHLAEALFTTACRFQQENCASFISERAILKSAVAPFSHVELLTAILHLNETPAVASLQVSKCASLTAWFLSAPRGRKRNTERILGKEAPGQTTAGDLTSVMLKVRVCIAFKQPIFQAEIDQTFGDIEKRAIVVRLREMELVTEFTGPGDRLKFSTTEEFLRHFKISSAEVLAGLMENGVHE